MPVGFRIKTKFERVSQEIVERYRGLPIANIADNMGRIYCVDQAIRPYNKVGMVGPAFTVKLPSGDNLMMHKAIELASAGDILVISGESCMTRSLCGALMMETALQKGIAGFLIDGCIRDVDELSSMNFACYARGVQANGPYRNGPGEIGVPVAIGCQVVMPGDLIVGDMDGVAVVPKADAAQVADAAWLQNKLEIKKLSEYRQGKVNRDWLSASLKEKKCEFLD